MFSQKLHFKFNNQKNSQVKHTKRNLFGRAVFGFGENNRPEITIAVSKKLFSTAVLRNRIKRRMRGVFVAIKKDLPKNLCLIFYPSKEVTAAPFPVLQKEILELIKQSRDPK